MDQSFTKYHLYYWDSRGAWREWDIYDNLADAKRVTKADLKHLPWKIEQRISRFIAESEVKAPHELKYATR